MPTLKELKRVPKKGKCLFLKDKEHARKHHERKCFRGKELGKHHPSETNNKSFMRGFYKEMDAYLVLLAVCYQPHTGLQHEMAA